MAVFYFIRHGKTDYSERNEKVYQGFGVQLAPLSEQGIEEIRSTAKDERLRGVSIILSSPYTRAAQTAAILSKELQADIMIETDLHEWLANKAYIYEDEQSTEKNYLEFVKNNGVYPAGENLDWEDMSAMRSRVFPILEKYKHYPKVAVACHGLLIRAVCGGSLVKNAEIVTFEY